MAVHTVGATCNVTLQQITPSFNYSPQPRLDELDYTTELVVLLSFKNNNEVEHHTCDDDYECEHVNPCCFTTRTKLTTKANVEKKLVFLVIPELLHFDVLVNAATDDGLPDYVTPGVWKVVKCAMFSFILDHINFTEKHNPMLKYEICIDVNVITHRFINYNNLTPFEKGVEEDERTKSLRKSLENRIFNWMKNMMI